MSASIRFVTCASFFSSLNYYLQWPEGFLCSLLCFLPAVGFVDRDLLFEALGNDLRYLGAQMGQKNSSFKNDSKLEGLRNGSKRVTIYIAMQHSIFC